MNKICLVGDILVDITLKTKYTPLKMRLGGIIHAARALWALNVRYDVGFFSPEYLDCHIVKYLSEIGCSQIIKLGNVTNLPYTILIGEVKEVGDQQYDFLLKDNPAKIVYDEENLRCLSNYSQIFAISGNYDFSVLNNFINKDCKLYYDIANNIKSFADLKLNRKLNILFLSTSSDLFKITFKTYSDFIDKVSAFADKVVLKENRGGSRAYDYLTNQKYDIPSQTMPIVHSVGVGDVYDIATVYLSNNNNFEVALYYASWIAANYASTTFPDDFKQLTMSTLQIPNTELKSLQGCSLPWEIRQNFNIYIAAPDFDFVNTEPIEKLCSSLIYHNFKPRRPIKENGQMSQNASKEERLLLFSKDMKLLDECDLLIAVILYDDPGTYIEIGLASQKRIPVIVYDPYERANNCMLTELPLLVSNDLDMIISKVFNVLSKQCNNGD